MEKRKKSRALSVDLRAITVEKHGQSQGYKSISRYLNVPVSTVHNVFKKSAAHGTVANLLGHGQESKTDVRLIDIAKLSVALF